MKWAPRAATMLCVAVALGGCSPAGPAQRRVDRSTDQPIDDSAPYWCKLIPHTALDRMTGSSQWRIDRDQIDFPAGGICQVDDPKLYQGISFEVATGAEARSVVRGIRKPMNAKLFNSYPGKLNLPAGTGRLTTTTPSATYWSYALFGCGRKTVAFEVFFATLRDSTGRPAKLGRNIVDDVNTLMIIVQRRYSVLAKCTLGASPEKQLVPSSD